MGNRQQLLDALVDRLLAEMGTLHGAGATPAARIASLARQLRAKLIEHPHLIGLVHEQSKTALMFQPVHAAVAEQLAALGCRGAKAALWLRALQVHVVGSVLLERSIERFPAANRPPADGDAWLRECADRKLVQALRRAPDRIEVFEFGLQALLADLERR